MWVPFLLPMAAWASAVHQASQKPQKEKEHLVLGVEVIIAGSGAEQGDSGDSAACRRGLLPLQRWNWTEAELGTKPAPPHGNSPCTLR